MCFARAMAMSKRTTFTTISPLPANITREVVIEFLHNHVEMIDLNPLVIERHPIDPPAHAPAEEQRCVWWSMTDKISYLPGGVVSGDVTYTAAFNDLPNGIQTHVYAPMGTDIRERWSLNGSLPGEPPEPIELGINAPRQGLYLREDVELRCNFVMSSFVKKTLKKAHGVLVERLLASAASASRKQQQQRAASAAHAGSPHSAHSSISHAPTYPAPYHPNQQLPIQYQQQRQQQQQHARSASATYSRATQTPPPPVTNPPPPYGHGQSNGLGQGQGQNQSRSSTPGTAGSGDVPEPLRINKLRPASAQHRAAPPYPQQQLVLPQQLANGSAPGYHGFPAELE